MEYENTNRGILFNNDKDGNDKRPDFRGPINVDGKEYWLSGWNKTTSKGEAISVSIQAKEDGEGYKKAKEQAYKLKPKSDDDDGAINLDNIPF